MQNPIVLHIPHSSVTIPSERRTDYVCSEEDLQREIQTLTDLYTDQIFPAQLFDSLLFPWSRLFVDVERFRNDAEEPMAEKGMGVLYTHGNELTRVRKTYPPADREAILAGSYDLHHSRLTQLVDRKLDQLGTALIIDCHSFPKQRLPYEKESNRQRPEICIGIDDYHTSQVLVDFSKHYFDQQGYTLAINDPFAGSLTPMKHYQKTKQVQSMMIEVRRDLFLKEGTFAGVDSIPHDGFDAIQSLLTDFIKEIAVL